MVTQERLKEVVDYNPLSAVCHRLAAEQAESWSGCDSASPAFVFVKENITNV